MAKDIFNPNSYGDTQIANALKYALEDHDTVASQGSSIATLRSDCSILYDLIAQVTYRGSDNKLQFDNPTVTVTGDGLTATLNNGILHIEKTAALIGDNPVITITGVNVPAGTWRFGIPFSALIPIMFATLIDSEETVVQITGASGVSEEFTTSAITGGSIEIEVMRVYSTPEGGTDFVLYTAESELSEKTAFPYFPSLREVSSNA